MLTALLITRRTRTQVVERAAFCAREGRSSRNGQMRRVAACATALALLAGWAAPPSSPSSTQPAACTHPGESRMLQADLLFGARHRRARARHRCRTRGIPRRYGHAALPRRPHLLGYARPVARPFDRRDHARRQLRDPYHRRRYARHAHTARRDPASVRRAISPAIGRHDRRAGLRVVLIRRLPLPAARKKTGARRRPSHG